MDEVQWEAIISQFDTNRNGSLNFSEFKNMMLKVHEKQIDGGGLVNMFA